MDCIKQRWHFLPEVSNGMWQGDLHVWKVCSLSIWTSGTYSDWTVQESDSWSVGSEQLSLKQIKLKANQLWLLSYCMRNLRFESISLHEKENETVSCLTGESLPGSWGKLSFSHEPEWAAEKRKQKTWILCLLLKPTSWVALNKSVILLISSVTHMTNE